VTESDQLTVDAAVAPGVRAADCDREVGWRRRR
jgi:hypothetical protein